MHIDDLSDFYLRLFIAVIEKHSSLPSGPEAIFFVESGEHTWLQVSQGIANALHKRNLLATNEVQSISLKEAAEAITKGNESLVEITLASKYVQFLPFFLASFANTLFLCHSAPALELILHETDLVGIQPEDWRIS